MRVAVKSIVQYDNARYLRVSRFKQVLKSSFFFEGMSQARPWQLRYSFNVNFSIGYLHIVLLNYLN